MHQNQELDLTAGGGGLPQMGLPNPFVSHETSSSIATSLRRFSTDDSSMMSSIVSRGSKLDLMVSLYANDFRLPPRSVTPGGVAAAPLAQSPTGSFRIFSAGPAFTAQLSRSSSSIRRMSSGQQSGPVLVGSSGSFRQQPRGNRTRSTTSSEEAMIIRRLQHRPLIMTTIFATSLFKYVNKKRRPLLAGDVNLAGSGQESAGAGDHVPFEDIGELVTSFEVTESLEGSVQASEGGGWESARAGKQPKHSLPTPRLGPPPLELVTEYHRSGRLLTQPSDLVRRVHCVDGLERTVDNVECDLVVHVGMILFGWLEVVDKLGQGTFGQVFLCKDLRICDGAYRSPAEYCPGDDFRYDYCSNDYCPNGDVQFVPSSNPLVAVKVVKGLKHFESQFLVEVDMLTTLNAQRDGHDGQTDPSVANQVHLAELGVGPDARVDRVCQMYAHGVVYGHRCVVLERLGQNLYDMITLNQNKGVGIHRIRDLGRQICQGISLLHSRCRIVHCDIKPENVLAVMPPTLARSGSDVSRASSVGSTTTSVLFSRDFANVKLIDFSSSCYHGQECYTYIQSRYYRAPEVIVGAPYGFPIDMWSLGCLLAELFLGLPLLPGATDHQQLLRIEEMFGPIPDEMLLGSSLRGNYFLDHYDQIDENIFCSSSFATSQGIMSPLMRSTSTEVFMESAGSSALSPATSMHLSHPPSGPASGSVANPPLGKRFTLMTDEQYARRHRVAETPFIRYFQYTSLDRLMQCCPLAPEEMAMVQANPAGRNAVVEDVICWRKRLLDLLHGLLQVDPMRRCTIEQALSHPFFSQ